MFRPSWHHAFDTSRRPSRAPARPPRAPRTPAPPTLKDDAAHAAEFAQHPHTEWFTEWWYLNVRDPKTGIALLATYVHSPFGLGLGEFATLVYPPGPEPGSSLAPFDCMDAYAPSEVSTSAERPDVKIGAPNTLRAIDDDTYRVTAASKNGRIAWDLTFRRVPGADPAWLLDDAQGPLDWEVGYWMTWLPHARASGTVTIDGKAYTIEDAAAYHDHNWGVWCSPIRNWQWLQASSASEPVALDLGYSDGFDPPRAALLDLDGRVFRFDYAGITVPNYSGFQNWPDTPWKYPERASAQLVDVTGRCKVDVEWHAPPNCTRPLWTSIVLFEQHVQVTLRISEKDASGQWSAPRVVKLDGIAEWSDSYLASWQTGEGLIGGYVAEATVFGAGVTGLTAAHELVERGFTVTVVERERALDPAGQHGMAVGGMARSHYSRVPRLGPAPASRPAGRPAPDSSDDHWRNAPVVFAAGSAEVPAAAFPVIDAAARAFRDRYADHGYRLRVTGSAASVEAAPRALAARRAEAVRDRLLTAGVAPDCVALHEDIASNQPDAVIALEDWILPGEHGFRFFPSYYRHVTDTMRRTPTYGPGGHQDGGRVFDRLAATPDSVMLRSGKAPAPPPTANASAVQMLRLAAQSILGDDYDPRDFLQLLIRITRYMATCPERRVSLEDISWWAYLSGYCPKTRCYLYRYSTAFSRDATASGRVLAAFDWRYGDARTNGSTFVQLFVPVPAPGNSFDGTLDAPTTEAWFVHWRRYLEDRGVRFVSGTLDRLEKHTTGAGREVVVPIVDGQPWRPRGRGPHYTVCATDAPAAETVSKPLPKVGVPRGLVGYTTTYDGRSRNPYRQPDQGPNDRFQTLSGVQYFFAQDFAISTHAYSLDAPWALTTLTMQNAWRRLPFAQKDGFAGLISVDIGSFKVPAGPEQVTAWDSTKERLGAQVWLQLESDLRTSAAMPLRLPRPSWFHVDDNLEFGDRDGLNGVIVENKTPYLVPITADWKHRPGAEPFDPHVAGATRPGPAEPGVWQAPHGGYPVHWGSLVYGGIYLKTFTRMTTMESANESGRHAVNAIIDHYSAHFGGQSVPPPSPAPAHHADPLGLSADEALPLYLGDYCGIWNIERYEPTAFDTLKAIDQLLFDLKLPHLFDLTGLELIPSILSHILPYRGDCSSTSQAPPAPVPPPAPWCPPFVGDLVRRWRSRRR